MIDSVSDAAGAAADFKKARRRVNASNPIKLDRLPPHALDMEQGVLGCQLISPNDCVGEVIEKLKGVGIEVHYDLRHQTIQDELFKMYDARIPIEFVTVMQRLKDKGLLDQVGGIAYLSQIQDAVPSAANLSYYLDIVREKYLLRKMIQTCTDVVGRVYDYEGEVDLLLDEVERDILKIRPSQKESNDIKDLIQQAINKIEERFNQPTVILGLSTGLADLDYKSDGMHKGEMITIAALPSRGKTALAVNAVVHNVLRGNPGVIFTAEMMPVQLVIRSICSEARVNFRHVSSSDLPKMTVAAAAINNSPLHIVNVSGMSIGQVRAIARRLKQKHNIQIGALDYIQLLTGDGDSREEKVSSISKGIKGMCMELEIPILALSQLTETTTGQFKTKYASAITEDTDSLWRLENDGEWESEIQPIKLLIEKSRDGETGKVNLTFLKTITRMEGVSKVSNEDIPAT